MGLTGRFTRISTASRPGQARQEVIGGVGQSVLEPGEGQAGSVGQVFCLIIGNKKIVILTTFKLTTQKL